MSTLSAAAPASASAAAPSSVSAAHVCKNFELSDAGKALLTPDHKPRAFLDLLIEKSLHDDAIMLMAHAMPKREAIWWACQCVRHSGGASLSPQSLELITHAEQYVAKPTDELRRKTFAMAEAANFDPPAGFVGMAVFFSSGSLSLPNLPPVPPKEHLAAGMVGNAVKVAAVAQGGAKLAELRSQFLNMGFDVSGGKNRWKE